MNYKDRAKLRFCGCPVHSPTVLITDGTDSISFKMDCKTPFPAMGYPAVIRIEAAKNCGAKWLEEVLGIAEYKIIDTTKKESKP
jgi:hypothetical protein